MAQLDSPTITLVFRGLFLLAFEKENKFCQVGVLKADRHCLKVNIKTNAASLPNSPELSFEIPDGDICFEVAGRPNAVDTYEPGLFLRDPSHDRRDFRWVLDLEGPELHNGPLSIITGALNRSIFVFNGLFYTYDSHTVRIVPPSSGPRVAFTAREIGCDIYLNEEEEAVFRYGPDERHSIKLKKEPDISYEISVENICPEEEVESQSTVSDFVHYYDVVDVPAAQQFKVDAFPPPPSSDRNPCDPTFVSITSAPLP
jgi:hypothetical protein